MGSDVIPHNTVKDYSRENLKHLGAMVVSNIQKFLCTFFTHGFTTSCVPEMKLSEYKEYLGPPSSTYGSESMLSYRSLHQ